jgi:hypothetical protein
MSPHVPRQARSVRAAKKGLLKRDSAVSILRPTDLTPITRAQRVVEWDQLRSPSHVEEGDCDRKTLRR